MDRLIDRLPSPAGLALWLYALAFVILPAVLAWKGFAYVLGTVLFAVGLRPHVEALVAGRPVHFAFHWGGRTYTRDYHLSIPSEGWAIRLISWVLVLGTMFGLPLIVYVLERQGVAFYAQLETQLPAILAALGEGLDYARSQFPGYVPDVEVREGAGWQGLSNLFSQVAGDAVADIKAGLKSVFGSLLGVVGGLVEDWIKLVIAAIIVGTILGGWKKEVAMHRRIVGEGLKHPRLRANALRFGELYQSGVSLFMIGYLEVALTLSALYALAMLVLPVGLSVGAIVFVGIVLGFVTAIPKIGGLGAMAIAFILMITNIEPGLGWFGYSVVSFGWAMDTAIRTAIMLAVSKVMGLLEAYNYTPEIVGEKLGMTKLQIIAVILIWAVGVGFFGMIWGILIALAFQAAMRLAEEDAAARRGVEESAAEAAE